MRFIPFLRQHKARLVWIALRKSLAKGGRGAFLTKNVQVSLRNSAALEPVLPQSVSLSPTRRAGWGAIPIPNYRHWACYWDPRNSTLFENGNYFRKKRGNFFLSKGARLFRSPGAPVGARNLNQRAKKRNETREKKPGRDPTSPGEKEAVFIT